MRLGLVARADNTGLGNQTFEFYLHMTPVKTMVVDISRLNGNKNYPERYPDAMFIDGFPNATDIDKFLEGLDVIFVAESPYNYHLYQRAHELGVKVAVQYNYEFFDYFVNPHYPKPDMLIAPSQWHYDDIEEWCKNNNVRHVYLHCPVNRDTLRPQEHKLARTFLHIAGKAAAHDRNGTETVIAASKYLKTEASIKVHFQGQQGLAHQATHDFAHYSEYTKIHGGNNIILQQQEYDNYADVYKDGDVMILPRRYGGNCLPLNEALSVGMPVIMPDISPNDYLLPAHWLVPATKIAEFTPRTTIDIYDCSPEELASKIDQFYWMDETLFDLQVKHANKLAQSISWQTMKVQYETVLEHLCSQT